MKELTKWQMVSFLSRGVAMGFGLIQSIVLVRLLSKGEYGIVQIGASIGAAFGIYQHLGLASGSTREISAAKSNGEVFKIFITATVIKYLITFPLAVGLFIFAEKIAVGTYNDPTLILPIKIYAGVLIAQGMQSIFNSVISGMKRFKEIFLYQALIAIISIIIYIPLVKVYRINGYFYALFVFNVVCSFVLGYIALKPLKGKFEWPSKSDYKRLLKELLSISLAIYAVKILYTFWERSGPLLLGVSISSEMVATFGFAMLYSKKLLAISDAVTDVNLPVFSDKYVKHFDEFKVLFTENFNKLFTFIMYSGIFVVFWSKNIIPLIVGSTKYNDAFDLVLPLTFAFVFYSFINISHSSLLIPAKLVKEMILTFAILLFTAVFVYFVSRGSVGFLQSMAYGMFISSIVSFLFMEIISRTRLKFGFLNHDHALILIQAIVICLASSIDNIFIKAFAFLMFTLLYIWAVLTCHFISKDDLSYAYLKIKKIFVLAKRVV